MSQLPDFAAPPTSSHTSPVAVLAAALLLGLAVADAWIARDLATRTEAAVAAVRADGTALAARSDRSRDAQRAAAAPALGALASPPERILGHVTGCLSADVRLTAFAVTYADAPRLRLSVEARTPQAWDRSLAALAASPHLRELRPSAERREDGLHVGVNAVWVEEAVR